MVRARSFLGSAALFGIGLVLPLRAHAQVSDAAMAESLFREGKRLMGEKKPAEACPKFAESFRLDAGLGTLLNLAACHEAEGKLATAWARFTEAETRARREGDNARAEFAAAHGRALEPRLSRLKIVLAPGANVEGLDIAIDDRHLSSAALGLPMPVDPGTHRFTATAPGKKPWSADVATPPEGQTLAVTIPVLEAAVADVTAAPVAALGAASPAPAVSAPARAPAPLPAPPPSADEKPSRITVPFVVSAVAAGAFTVGAVVTGVMYSGAQEDFDDANADVDEDRFRLRNGAKTLGIANLVCTGGAVLAAGAAVAFFAIGGPSKEAPRAARLELSPLVGPTGAGLLVRGEL
jgi:hypothetical protein